MSITSSKYIGLFWLCSILCAGAEAQDIVFLENEYNFDTISVKEKSVTHRFTFENKGNTPLVVKSVYGRCSCIDACWTPKPVMPGDTGSVVVRYSIFGTGVFNKRLKVVTNKNNTFIRVFGTVRK